MQFLVQLHSSNLNHAMMFLLSILILKTCCVSFLLGPLSDSHSSFFGAVLHGLFESLALAPALAYPLSRTQGYFEI